MSGVPPQKLRVRFSLPDESSSVLQPAENTERPLLPKGFIKPALKVRPPQAIATPLSEQEITSLANNLASLSTKNVENEEPRSNHAQEDSCHFRSPVRNLSPRLHCNTSNVKQPLMESGSGRCSPLSSSMANSNRTFLAAQKEPLFKVRLNRSTEQRQQLIARSRQKQSISGLKLSSIVPEGVQVPSSPQGQKKRCGWVTSQCGPSLIAYHDEEWGVPVHDDRRLFEMLVLSATQAEVSWSGVLEKREQFRALFADFDPAVVATFDEKRIKTLKANASLVPHESKLRGIVENANLVMKIIEEYGSFDKFVWGFVNNKTLVNKYRLPNQVPVKSPKSELLSKTLMKRGFRFVGPTMMYSFMQAVGMVNDHLVTCFRHQECSESQDLQKRTCNSADTLYHN